MSTIGGAFSETELLQFRVKAAELLFDDRIKQQFVPQYDVLKAVQHVQTANINAAFSRRKEYDVEIMWENFCDIEAAACSDSCTIGGNKSSTNAETKTLACFREVGFSMSEQDFIDNEFEMNVAKALIKADKELVENFAQYAVAQLETFKGTNALTTGKGTVAGGETTIPAAYWNASLFAYISRVGIMNKFTNPILLSGSNLYEAYALARANAANANGKGDFEMFGTMPLYFDLFNIDTVNTPDLKTYMLSMGSLAMASKAFNPDVPERTFEHVRYTMPSNFFPALKYDVWYNNECEDSASRRVKHNWTIRLTADIYNNPAGCDLTNTGVLSFKCS